MNKKILLVLVAVILVVAMCTLFACTDMNLGTTNNAQDVTTDTGIDTTPSGNTGSTESAVTDDSITAEETTEEFQINTSDGTYSLDGSIYTITSAGTYTLSGYLNGEILVDAGDDDEIVIELSGVTIEYNLDAPIKIVNASKVEISAKKNTDNVIKDTRSAKTVDTDTLGEGAIYAKTDLQLKGNGTLVIIANYNNGIHTTKDLKIKNLSLKVTAVNNAIKGNDSVTINSGNIVVISTAGDGIKTENTDANKKGVVRGDITINGTASVTIYAAGDGIQAAHNFTMSEDSDGNSPYVTIYTGSYSGYTSKNATTDSYKGVKVENILTISGGTIDIKSFDDGLHANYGTTFEAGGTGVGTINITGGVINMTVYSTTVSTPSGRGGPRGWNNQQTVTGADGIHADYILSISGGTITIDSSYEGLEANIINISGGTSIVAANDDGVNAKAGIATPQINITGGYLDVTVSSNGDTDGIDSNGTYTQSGGIVITRGPNSTMAAALDTEGTASITGGTLIILGSLGERGLTKGSEVSTYSLYLNSSGSHSVTIDGTVYTLTNKYAYSRTLVYSSVSVTA